MLAPDIFRLTQIRGHSLRTESVEGQIASFPCRDLPFILVGSPLGGNLVRVVKTSPVVSTTYFGNNGSQHKFWLFHTRSGSIYKLERVHD